MLIHQFHNKYVFFHLNPNISKVEDYIFYDVYSKAIKDIDPFDALTDDDIKTAIRNSSSLKPNLFVPEIAFEILTK